MSDETIYRIPRVSNEEARYRVEALHGFPSSLADEAVSPEESAEEKRRAEAWQEKLRARFDPPSDPYAMAKRLNIAVGDPENERDVA